MDLKDLNRKEILIFAVLACLVIIVGFYPGIILNLSDGPVTNMMDIFISSLR